MYVMALLLTCRFVQGQTAPIGLLEQQFKRADSALSYLLDRPETRMKEIAPVENLFREALANRPEFMTVLRTNSKGQIVNIVAPEDSAFVKNADVSGKEWYSAPQESKRPYYGPLVHENQGFFLFWSKPILVRNSLGMSRFGGVIAAKISLQVCCKLFAARFQGPFQILLKGKEFYYLSWNEHAPYEEKTVRVPGVSGLTCRFVSKKQPPDTMPAHEDGAHALKTLAPQAPEIKDTSAGAETGLMNVSALGARNNMTAEPFKKTSAQAGALKNIVPTLAGTVVIIAVFITGLIVSGKRKSRKNLIKKTPDVTDSPDGLVKELDEAIQKSLGNEARQIDRTPEMEEKARADLMQELKKEVSEKEADMIRNNVRAELKEDIRSELLKNEAQAIRVLARQALREEIAQKLRHGEYEKIMQEEKDTMRTHIAEKEMGPIKVRLLEELTEQIRAQVREETESVRERLREEERTRINDQERPGIIEAERNRLREQEGPGLRQEIREGLREEEIKAMHARVKTEIYTETVQALNAGLEEKYKGAFERKLEEYKGEVEKRVRGEIKGRIKSEYHGLIEHIEGLSHSLDNVEALDSLSQTITLLHDEKKKYKYFNLNTAQTESLLEYLKRVQNRFSIFLDKLDEKVREMVLKVNSVMNTLDNSDSD